MIDNVVAELRTEIAVINRRLDDGAKKMEKIVEGLDEVKQTLTNAAADRKLNEHKLITLDSMFQGHVLREEAMFEKYGQRLTPLEKAREQMIGAKLALVAMGGVIGGAVAYLPKLFGWK